MKDKIIDALLIILIALMLFVNKNYRVVVVEGRSMEPTLHDNQVCILQLNTNLTDGDIVVVDAKDIPSVNVTSVIKRYNESKSTAQKIYITGDNITNSFDSRKFGLIDRSNIIGKIVKVF